MSSSTKPWSGLMTAADLAAYGPAFGSPDRSIRAGTSPAVLVVDMIRNAVDSAYPAGYAETGRPAVAATRRLLDVARSIGLPIYYTKAYPEPGYRPRPVERGRWRIDGNARPGGNDRVPAEHRFERRAAASLSLVVRSPRRPVDDAEARR